MRKRERENPCGICGHYHKYEEGEVCGVCGHRMADVPAVHVSAFPTEILPEFLYLGSYDNAARAELLKTQSISRILNTVPTCQNLYKNSFTYHYLPDEKRLPFDDAIQYLEQCERDRARVLVHCMSGKNRSPAIVIAYLMRSRGWRLSQSYQWVKERRPSIELNPAAHEQLQEFELKIFGSTENNTTPSFSFGFSSTNETSTPPPSFNNSTAASSVFSHPPFDDFAFGATGTQNDTAFSATTNANDITMGGS